MTTLEESIHYQFAKPDLLKQALSHKSFHNENRNSSVGHNELMEFLGDAVIDLCLTQKLMAEFPEYNEGHLSKIRASLVNETTLAEIARGFKLEKEIKLGKGEVRTSGHEKPRLLASAFEALVGGVFLDSNYEKTYEFVERLFTPYMTDEHITGLFAADYKTRLQEVAQQKLQLTPVYTVVSESGPDHEKSFVAQVVVGEKVLATGAGLSKKAAEQAAACDALKELL